MLNKKEIPSPLYLIQHLRLNEARWWEKGTKKLILGILFYSSGSLSQSKIKKKLTNEYGIIINYVLFKKVIEDLIRNKDIIEVEDGKLLISLDSKRKLELDISEATRLEENAKKSSLS